MLVHKPTKKLLLNLREPEAIAALIPGSKVVNIKGHDIVSVNHDLDTVRVLRNMGIKAQRPIAFYYEWSGRYKPFLHQLETSEFLTLNPRNFLLSDMGCVDSETEYLSPTGWVRMDQYVGGQVAQYVPDTGAIEFVDPTEYVRLPCPQMIYLKTKYGLDQMLSPEHRVLLTSQRNKAKREVVQAHELLARHDHWVSGGNLGTRSLSAAAYSTCAIPCTFTTPGGPGFPLAEAWIRLQIAVIADGHFANGTDLCSVRLKKQRKQDRLRQILLETCMDYTEAACLPGDGFRKFTFRAPLRDKEFGPSWWACTDAQLAVVADEVMHWDGHFGPGNKGDRFHPPRRPALTSSSTP